jgi:hypothetical protein
MQRVSSDVTADAFELTLTNHVAVEEHGILFAAYEEQMQAARTRFSEQPSVKSLFGGPMDAMSLEAFLIGFSVLGVGMAEPVEGWIRRAGERCGELGLAHLAKALVAHAPQESNHHLWMLSDAANLISHWNAQYARQLDFEDLLKVEAPRGVRMYCALHEDTIGGHTPYGQLAIEYEIEMLSTEYGPKLIERCRALLGPEILESLSFLREHVELDVGHTHFDRIQLGQLLNDNASFLGDLVAAGSAALDAYAVFLEDCLNLLSKAVEPCP